MYCDLWLHTGAETIKGKKLFAEIQMQNWMELVEGNLFKEKEKMTEIFLIQAFLDFRSFNFRDFSIYRGLKFYPIFLPFSTTK